mmetsp:Transcript_4383/g.5854  ORF Transcript_4383/g.5854 Transcript_4383/m.5854 type:complete len:137 (-) Transcript_4383:728-1138(-)
MLSYMKTLITTVAIMSAAMAFGQQEGTVQPTVEPVQGTPSAQYKGATHTEVSQSRTVTISKRPGQAQRVHDVAYYNEEIAKVDAQIAAIDSKIAHVNATPSELAIAQQNGWFQQMDQTKIDLNQHRAELVEKRDNL